MDSRNITEWDMQLLIQANKCLNVNVSGDIFRELKNLKTKFTFLELEVSDEDFDKYCDEISVLLLELGLSQKEIDIVKLKPIEIESMEEVEDNSKIKSLKDSGNEAFKTSSFKKAIDFYTQAICLSGVPRKEIAMLYSNRSVAYLRLGDISSAKEDAKISIQLSLTWWKGYYRLAMVHKAEEQYELCLKNLELCRCFHSNPDNITQEIVLCNSLIGQKKKEEHFHPMQFCEKDVEYRKKMSSVISPTVLLQGCDDSSRKVLQACLLYDQATRYYTGYQVPQNYEEAARWYKQAASEGNPEAMYSLAKMYLDGIGVERDRIQGVKLLEQAASMNNLVKIVTYGLEHTEVFRGVAAAQHSLGVLYEGGIGVTKDYTKAKLWYERAIKNWSGAAANNMAMMCLNGVGVTKSLPSAIQYWKLGAGMANVKCMENLVETYFESREFGNMQRWYLYAVHHKSEFESDDRFKKHFRRNVTEDFKPKNFFKSLWREIEKGPLKHLVDQTLKKFFLDDKKSTDQFHTAMRKGLF